MIAEIIPTQKMPRGLSSLSYIVPAKMEKQIRVGQLVNMPLRHKLVQGVVATMHEKTQNNYKLKYIHSLVSPKPIFTHQQLKLFTELADYYCTSITLFIHFNLPKLIKKNWEKLPLELDLKEKRQKREPEYFWWTKTKERLKFYQQQVQLSRQKKEQLLIIVPQIKDIYQLAEELNIKDKFTAVHRQLKRQENFDVWQQAMNKTTHIFIGTRSALFYPYSRLGILIIDEENSIDHKQYDMNPRYDVYTASQKMADVYNCQTYYSSYAPSTKLFRFYQPQPKNGKLPGQAIELINIRHLLASKNYTFISERLLSSLKQTLKQKKSAFIFINHKGEARLTKCNDCGYSFNCPHCQLPLIKEGNKLICYYCQYQEELPPFCPHCHGPNLKHSGLGTQKIARQLKQLLPEAPIQIIDKNNPAIKKSQTKPAQIIIGTQFALDKINWPQTKLIGIINSDQLWQHTEFMANELAYQLLIKILTLAPQNAKIILQTFAPQHNIIQALIKQQPILFYKSELKTRKKFNYPPYTNLIKISCLHKNKDKALKQIEKIYNKLNKLAPKKGFEISAPMPILRQKVRQKYKFNIIIKLKQLALFGKIAKHIPAECLIDIHPVKLLD